MRAIIGRAAIAAAALFGMIPTVHAQEAPDEAALAAREAAAPELAQFTGGDAGGLLIAVAVVALIVVLVIWLLDDVD